MSEGRQSARTRPSRALAADASDTLGRRLEQRVEAGERFFAAEAERIASVCHRMAERFARGGRVVALGQSPQARFRDRIGSEGETA